jgi:hypothetical protein
MTFTLESDAPFACELNWLLIKASFDIANEWFFYDGAFIGGTVLEQTMKEELLLQRTMAPLNITGSLNPPSVTATLTARF